MNERRSAVATVDERASRTFALDQRIRYRYSAPVTNLRQRLKVVPHPPTDRNDEAVGSSPSKECRLLARGPSSIASAT